MAKFDRDTGPTGTGKDNVMHRRRDAFSLIEITIVILLIGLMAAVSAPRFGDALRSVRVESAARQMAAHVRYIRRVAVNQGRTTTLNCDNQLHTYGCNSVDFPERIGDPLRVAVQTEFDSTITLSADFDSKTSLTFNFEGVPYVGANRMASGSVVLQSGETAFVITIAAGTGKVEVSRVTGANAFARSVSL